MENRELIKKLRDEKKTLPGGIQAASHYHD